MELDAAQIEHYMRLAIDTCRRGIAEGNSPFGCVIVSASGRVFTAHNTVWQNTDITAHAEIVCLRQACHAMGVIDLSGAWLFSTAEPCPMCAAACHWARIDRVVFGASIEDAARAGFNELPISCAEMLSRSPTTAVGAVMVDECRELFDEWSRVGKAASY